MNARLAAPFLVMAIAVLAACDRAEPPAPAATAADPDTLAVVNGTAITRSDVFAYAGLAAAPDRADSANVLEEMINLELLRQEAIAQGIDQEEDIRMILRNLEANLLASQVIERRVRGIQFTEAEIQAEYETQLAGLGQIEYRARHILVESEGEAQALIGELNDGGDFAALAAEHSLDGSAAQGGDLGWFVAPQMVPAFSAAAAALEPGQYTREPIRSEFGWHVILLEETRALEPPPLLNVWAQIEEILHSRALRAYMDELRAKAEIRFPERPAQ
jgi:peptidyl-prolyl cis-trans isomerase C